MTRKYIRMGLKIKKKLSHEVVELQKVYVFKKIYIQAVAIINFIY
jgi:hypothetical protein